MKKTFLITWALVVFLLSLSLFSGSFFMHQVVNETLGTELSYAQSMNGFITKNAEGEHEKQIKESSMREDHQHISIYYQENFSDLLPMTKEILDLAIDKNERLLGEISPVPFDLLVFENLEELNGFAALKDAGGFYSDFHKVMGIYNYGEESILEEDTHAFYRFQNILVHEYTHYAFIRKVSNQAHYPIWFTEGLAEYVASDPDEVQFPYFEKIPFEQLTSNEQWNDALTKRMTDPYLQSHYALAFLTTEYGEGVIHQIIESVEETRNFEESLLEVTGLTVLDLEDVFLDDYKF